MKGKWMVLVLCLLLALSLPGCGAQPSPTVAQLTEATPSSPTAETESEAEKTLTLTDMEGRQVTLDVPIDRVVVDQWSTAELLMTTVGERAVDMLLAVGNTKNSDMTKALYAARYPQLSDLPNIGGGKDSSLDPEMIVSLAPDLFIVNSTTFLAGYPETISKLEEVGIETVILTMAEDPMHSPQEGIELVGRIFGAEERAQEINDFINSQFDLIEARDLSNREDKPTVYQEKGSGSSEQYDVTTTSGGWASIIELAGGENIAKDVVGESGLIDPEYLISTDPDFIIITGALGYGEDIHKGTQVIDDYAARTGWSNLSAVTNNNIYELPHGQARDQFCFYPSLYLAKLFYPDDFADVEPTALLEEFFDRFMLIEFDDGVWFAHREQTVDG